MLFVIFVCSYFVFFFFFCYCCRYRRICCIFWWLQYWRWLYCICGFTSVMFVHIIINVVIVIIITVVVVGFGRRSVKWKWLRQKSSSLTSLAKSGTAKRNSMICFLHESLNCTVKLASIGVVAEIVIYDIITSNRFTFNHVAPLLIIIFDIFIFMSYFRQMSMSIICVQLLLLSVNVIIATYLL